MQDKENKETELIIIIEQSHPIHDQLPCIVQWPETMDALTKDKVAVRYFDASIRPNRFIYASILLKSIDTNSALRELKLAGAFSSSNGRQALVEVLSDARDAGEHKGSDCSDDLLDTLERYACYAFSLEDDELSVGCGVIHTERNISCKRRREFVESWEVNRAANHMQRGQFSSRFPAPSSS